MSWWNSLHTLSHLLCCSGSLHNLFLVSLCSNWIQKDLHRREVVKCMWIVLSDRNSKFTDRKKVDFWGFSCPQSDSLWRKFSSNPCPWTHHQPPLTIRSNSDCLRRTTEEHCTYFTIQTLWIHRQRRGAWWEISAAFTVSESWNTQAVHESL